MRLTYYIHLLYSEIVLNKLEHVINLLFIWNCKCYSYLIYFRIFFFYLIKNSFESLIIMTAVHYNFLSYALYSFKTTWLLKLFEIAVEVLWNLKVASFRKYFKKFFYYLIINFTKCFHLLNLNYLTLHHFSSFKNWLSFQTGWSYNTRHRLFDNSRFFFSNQI